MKYTLMSVLWLLAFAASNVHAQYGRGMLKALLAHSNYMLVPYYSGTMTLIYSRGVTPSAQKQALKLNAFTYETGPFSETDCPLPTGPAIFTLKRYQDTLPVRARKKLSPDDKRAMIYDNFVYPVSEPALWPDTKALSKCKTLAEVKLYAPNLVSQSQSKHYCWFNWFQVINGNQLEVIFLRIDAHQSGELSRIEIWRGKLNPKTHGA